MRKVVEVVYFTVFAVILGYHTPGTEESTHECSLITDVQIQKAATSITRGFHL